VSIDHKIETVMDNQNKMISAASAALHYIFSLNPNDKILIVADTFSLAIAYAFEQASRANGSTVDLSIIALLSNCSSEKTINLL